MLKPFLFLFVDELTTVHLVYNHTKSGVKPADSTEDKGNQASKM